MFANFRSNAAQKAEQGPVLLAEPKAGPPAGPSAVLTAAHERVGIRGVLHDVLLAARTGLAGPRTDMFGGKTRKDAELIDAFSRTLDVHAGVFRAVMDKHGDVGALATLCGKIKPEPIPRTVVSDAPLGLQMAALLERGARGLQLMQCEARSEADDRAVQRMSGSIALAQTFWARHGIEVAMGVTAVAQAKTRDPEIVRIEEPQDDYEFAPR